MRTSLTRRTFLGALSAGALGLTLRPARAQGGGRRPVVISSGNGVEACRSAYAQLIAGADPLDAIVEGVRIVEDDPEDQTVGLGGLPNEEGVVQLDSSVMHGPSHRAGAVAALERIKNPAAVAREVARRTDHVLIVGEGALKFARRMGFKEENLLTEKSRQAWLRWRATLNREDDWLQRDEFDLPTEEAPHGSRGIDHTTGTIHCSAVDGAGDLAGVTTTSGLAWKIPGRVGDSPIIGAGLYTDNEVGSAGATGRGEAVMQVCGARLAVMRMEAGDTPTEACLHVLRHIISRTSARRLIRPDGRPAFDVVMYAVRKDGLYGSAAIRKGRAFAVCDANGARREPCASPYD